MRPEITVFSSKCIKPYTGFIYIWRDALTKKSYIGSHRGAIDDGYIGSGSYFVNAYKKRKLHFRRKVLEFVCGTSDDLKDRENYWLSMIKDSELKIKYYNQINFSTGIGDNTKITQRFSGFSEESLEKLRIGQTGKVCFNDGCNNIWLSKADEIPEGYVKGGVTSIKQKPLSKSIWINNTILETYVKRDSIIPEGYVKGRLKRPKTGKCRGTVAYNNGIINKMFSPNAIPDGWIKGYIKTSYRKRKV